MDSMAERAQIIVKGTVQGVGFRPFVFNLAESLRLKGYVINTGEGVFIDIEGAGLSEFLRRIRAEAPPLSQITDIVVENFPCHGYSDFSIRHSKDLQGDSPFTLVSPDVSVCPDCLKEMLDPADRRYLYPFINCTNCGPRYSITQSVPYDRPNTTMAPFAMCRACEREYDDPVNRRFHAQPNACPKCGPEVQFRVRGSEFGVKGGRAIQEAIQILKQGGIIAVKGLGGFHIACDASNHRAVTRLRGRKRKSNKPFAIMAPDLTSIESVCLISREEQDLLLSNKRPIVLLSRKSDSPLSQAVSPNNQFMGVMLPYTPLHYLLFYHPIVLTTNPADPHFTALVMTSGNLSEEPIVRDNDGAVKKLADIVDAFLLHDRDIFMRVDDSVISVRSSGLGVRSNSKSRTETSFIRRSRGYAPEPIELQEDGPEVLACGADLKNTFTITKGKFAIPSQHIGDMENYETVQFFEESLANLKAVYRADPKIIVHDLHPGYLSTQWASEFGMRNARYGMKTYAIQHHYAHIGSVMAEHGLFGKVIGVAFDGTGYGTDGNLWGGEFLIADIAGFKRAGQLKYIPLPGGEAAIRETWRTAVSTLLQTDPERTWGLLEKTGFLWKYGKSVLESLILISRSSELSPLSSGAGRLFDAVAALLGVCERNTFEGEAAMALEALTIENVREEYPVEVTAENGYTVVDFGPCIMDLIADLGRPQSLSVIASKFHNTVASAIRSVVKDLGNRFQIDTVALSGGTFQNRYLLKRILTLLSSEGMRVFTNQRVPCNDGGISLGQAFLIRERLR